MALGALAAVRRERLPARRDLARIAFYGVLWLVVYNIVLNEAERRVDAGTAAMLVNVGPILIALLAGLLLREGFPRGLLAGCVVAFAGTAIIAVATSSTASQPGGEQGSASSPPSRMQPPSSSRSRCSAERRRSR